MRRPALRRIVVAAVALSAVAACSASDDSTFAERQELANTAFTAAVPKSSGRTLTATFKRFCLEPSAEGGDRSAALRAAGFVPQGGWRGDLREYVTNDSRPAVRISQDGRLCGVRARAQTGQDTAIRAAVKAWYPQAVTLKSGDQRDIWQIGPAEGIAIQRLPRSPHYNEILLAHIQL